MFYPLASWLFSCSSAVLSSSHCRSLFFFHGFVAFTCLGPQVKAARLNLLEIKNNSFIYLKLTLIPSSLGLCSSLSSSLEFAYYAKAFPPISLQLHSCEMQHWWCRLLNQHKSHNVLLEIQLCEAFHINKCSYE